MLAPKSRRTPLTGIEISGKIVTVPSRRAVWQIRSADGLISKYVSRAISLSLSVRVRIRYGRLGSALREFSLGRAAKTASTASTFDNEAYLSWLSGCECCCSLDGLWSEVRNGIGSRHIVSFEGGLGGVLCIANVG